jgi:hypothetical protein
LKSAEPNGASIVAGGMPRVLKKPSEAQQRDAELTQVEAELKVAREQLEAVNAEIRRSQKILVALQAPPIDPGPIGCQFDGAMAAFPFAAPPAGFGDDESPA